jgi:RND superfamily putative drug exporter
VTGPAGYFADFAKVFSGFDSTLLSITAVIVIVILLVTYRSPVLWLLPLTTVFVALTAAQAVIYLLARNGGLTVNGQSAFILTVLVFGAGTDYALLLTARYREELRRHADRHQAMAVALGRAAPAIIASGATVILSLLCLLVAELASTRSLGPVMAIGVAVGLGAMLTLLPALLVIVGRWVFWPRRPTLGSAEPTERGLWARIGQRVARRPRLVWVVTAVVLGLLALGTTGLEANGLQSKDSFRTKPEAVTGEAVLARHFAAGAGNPVQVIGRAEAAGQLQATLAGTAGVTAVTRPVLRDGSAYLEGTLTSSPDSQASYDLVDRLRVSVHAIGGAEAKVGGAAPSTSTSSGPPATTGTWWCRWCWSWWPSSWACCCGPSWPRCCWWPPWCCRSGPRWGSAPWSSTTSSASPGPTRRSPCGPLCSWSRWVPTTTSSS